MFERVLFPTDFSGYSAAILSCIAEIPGIKEIILLHVADAVHSSEHGGARGPHNADIKILMGEKKKYLESLGLKVDARIDVMRHGNVYESILNTAENENVSLIAMGARGKSLKDLFLGSVSTDVLNHANTSLLLMKFKSGEGPKGKTFEKFCPRLFSKVLVPTDFSEPAGTVISSVKGVKGIEAIVLLNVVDKSKTDIKIEGSLKEAKKKIEDIKEELVRAGFNVKCLVRAGYPPEEIVSVAENEDVSLIAMSPQGEGWLRELKELFVGSTTSAVARRAYRPVLIMRAGQKSDVMVHKK